MSITEVRIDTIILTQKEEGKTEVKKDKREVT